MEISGRSQNCKVWLDIEDLTGAGRSDPNDDGLAPALVAAKNPSVCDLNMRPRDLLRFESRAHDLDVARAVKGIVTPTVRHLDQLLLD